jgi:hypothetical protein
MAFIPLVVNNNLNHTVRKSGKMKTVMPAILDFSGSPIDFSGWNTVDIHAYARLGSGASDTVVSSVYTDGGPSTDVVCNSDGTIEIIYTPVAISGGADYGSYLLIISGKETNVDAAQIIATGSLLLTQ